MLAQDPALYNGSLVLQDLEGVEIMSSGSTLSVPTYALRGGNILWLVSGAAVSFRLPDNNMESGNTATHIFSLK